jgi:aspartate carbamoyltransferase
MQFKGRSISVVKDFTVDEQEFLYSQTRLLKEAIKTGNDSALDPFRVNDSNAAVYLIFMEDSTRTKESFRNAALFHRCKVNVFDSASSSFKKGETIADTLRMLCGYSIGQSVFVMRTKLEGVCTAMREVIGDYCEKVGLPRASFMNGGDGKHEHPTQEFLDEFTFLEHNNWDKSQVHVALVGDLLHGRTVHSKVDGLRVFKKVRVDLVAPSELAMPNSYVEGMRRFGYEIRIFESIDDYLALGDDTAPIWYFTRFQIERMGEDIIAKEAKLRRAITFREEFLPLVDQKRVKFFHPLPRHAQYPEIPPFLDTTPLNGWELQSMNGYFTRIIELAMVLGKYDTVSPGKQIVKSPSPVPSFILEVTNPTSPIKSPKQPERLHIKQLSHGVVIDHIGMHTKSTDVLWKQITNIRTVLDIHSTGSQGVFPSSRNPGTYKGLISLPDFPLDYFTRQQLKKLAAIAPGCTLSVIKDNVVIQKFQLEVPPRIYNFKDISCRNTDCVSHRNNHQAVMVYFDRAFDLTFKCPFL